MSARLLAALVVLAAPLVACGLSMKVPDVDLETGESKPASSAATTATDAGDAGAGLPCDVAALLAANCTSCHSTTHAGAPMALVTYEDLVAPAKSDPTKTVYALATERMSDTSKPMPPSGLLSADTIAVFATWADAGAPETMCSAVDAAAPEVDADLPECVLNSDCPGTLICRSGTCDVECITDKDCTVTWTCEDTRCHPPTTPTTDDSVDAASE